MPSGTLTLPIPTPASILLTAKFSAACKALEATRRAPLLKPCPMQDRVLTHLIAKSDWLLVTEARSDRVFPDRHCDATFSPLHSESGIGKLALDITHCCMCSRLLINK